MCEENTVCKAVPIEETIVDILKGQLTIESEIIKKGAFHTIVGAWVFLKVGDKVISKTKVVF